MKGRILTMIGTFGGVIAAMFGGWDMSIQTLVLFMGIDYVMGLMVAGVFKKSKKTKSGALSSKKCWEGLARKGVTLLIVLVGAQLDRLTGAGNILRDGICIAYITNEAISIIENAGLMGVPIPSVLTRMIDALRNQTESGGTK